MPERAYGTTTFHTASHRVAPSARAASRCVCGTASSTSRETLTMNGTIMTARRIPAVSSPIP